MMEITVIASGSSGNCLLIRVGTCAVLVDAGLSAKRICEALEQCGTGVSDLKGILLTHEHGDHTRGLKVLSAKARTPVYATPLTAHSLRQSGVDADWNLFASGARFQIGSFEVHPFSVPHDAADPVGFVIRYENRSFAILTDLGYATRQVIECVKGVNALIIETNHDEALLQQDTKRPWSVKQRILSRHGHLSNAAAAEVISQIATDALRHVVLGHLSRDCNSIELAHHAVRAKLSGCESIEIHCASPEEAGGALRLVI